jgi:hypothetical protein
MANPVVAKEEGVGGDSDGESESHRIHPHPVFNTSGGIYTIHIPQGLSECKLPKDSKQSAAPMASGKWQLPGDSLSHTKPAMLPTRESRDDWIRWHAVEQRPRCKLHYILCYLRTKEFVFCFICRAHNLPISLHLLQYWVLGASLAKWVLRLLQFPNLKLPS